MSPAHHKINSLVHNYSAFGNKVAGLYVLAMIPPNLVCWVANARALKLGTDQVNNNTEEEVDVVDEDGIGDTWKYKLAQIFTIFVPYRLFKEVKRDDDEGEDDEPKIEMSLRMKLIR